MRSSVEEIPAEMKYDLNDNSGGKEIKGAKILVEIIQTRHVAVFD